MLLNAKCYLFSADGLLAETKPVPEVAGGFRHNDVRRGDRPFHHRLPWLCKVPGGCWIYNIFSDLFLHVRLLIIMKPI